MLFFAVLLLSMSLAASFNTLDSQTLSFSDLLRRLNELEQRLQVQERVNKDQETTIKLLILENKKFKKYGIPGSKQFVDVKMQNGNRGLNKTYTGGKSVSTYKAYLSNSKLKSKISDENFQPESCCPESMLTFKKDKPKRRSVTGGVAFYSYLSHPENNPGSHQTIVFDNVITNVGGNYNRHTGTFFCPENGVYTFSWTLYCSAGGYIYSEIVVNSNAVGAMRCGGEGASFFFRHTTGVVVIEINQGDAVYVRTHPSNSISGSLQSYSYSRSSFSGWKLF